MITLTTSYQNYSCFQQKSGSTISKDSEGNVESIDTRQVDYLRISAQSWQTRSIT